MHRPLKEGFTLHTLTYLRKAVPAKDGHAGLLYRHRWPTGQQELIFPTEQAADSWLAAQRNESKLEQQFSAVFA